MAVRMQKKKGADNTTRREVPMVICAFLFVVALAVSAKPLSASSSGSDVLCPEPRASSKEDITQFHIQTTSLNDYSISPRTHDDLLRRTACPWQFRPVKNETLFPSVYYKVECNKNCKECTNGYELEVIYSPIIFWKRTLFKSGRYVYEKFEQDVATGCTCAHKQKIDPGSIVNSV